LNFNQENLRNDIVPNHIYNNNQKDKLLMFQEENTKIEEEKKHKKNLKTLRSIFQLIMKIQYLMKKNINLKK
jgi:hypothetical protein